MVEHRHATHPEIVKRLKRADGHIKSIIEMIDAAGPEPAERCDAARRSERRPRAYEKSAQLSFRASMSPSENTSRMDRMP